MPVAAAPVSCQGGRSEEQILEWLRITAQERDNWLACGDMADVSHREKGVEGLCQTHLKSLQTCL